MGKTKKILFDRKKKRSLFIILMLAYPVFHFLFFWIFVNIKSVIMTFEKYIMFTTDKYPIKGWNWAGFDNYINIFNKIKTDYKFVEMITNSASYIILNLLIILPVSLIASYFLFKKIPLSSFFRVLFFFPSIIPIVVLTLAFKTALDPIRGLTTSFSQMFSSEPYMFFGSAQSSQMSIYLFCLWSGLGFNIILLSNAMARVPIDILESGKLEGVSKFSELFLIVIPLIWPTLTTMTMFALMSIFNVALQPMLLSGNINNTIGLEIFSISQGGKNLEYAATLGMICSLIGAPIILLIKYLMEKCFVDVSY